jgi:hypothetical protein
MLAVAGTGAVAAQAAAGGPAAGTGWRISYHLHGTTTSVTAIAATGPDDAWAVGGRLATIHGQGQGVAAIFHWNGTSWSAVPLPGPPHDGYFAAVSAVSPTDVWAFSGSCISGCSLFAANWNGTKWSWRPGYEALGPTGAVAFSRSNAWIADDTSIGHWTGTSWQTYPAPGWNGVWSISGVTSSDIWAVGLAAGGLQPEALLWNGTSWQPTSIPAIRLPANGQAWPTEVAAESADSVWMAGYIDWPAPGTQLTDYKPFLLRWNGTAWSRVRPLPALPAGFGFTQITGDGTGGLWVTAVAMATAQTDTPDEQLVHYSGGTWTVTALPPIPHSRPSSTNLSDMSLVPGTQDLWAPATYEKYPSLEPSDLIFGYQP